MKKRIFNWGHSKNKKYGSRKLPNFNFVEACVKDIVIWWDENQFCVDMDRIDEVRVKKGEKTCYPKLSVIKEKVKKMETKNKEKYKLVSTGFLSTSKTKKTIGVTFALLVVALIAGANVSATVSYQEIRPLTIEEARAQIEAVINNPTYQKLKAQGVPYFESHYNATVKQHINETISAYLLEKVLPSEYEPLCPLLAELCYGAMCLMIALFGHGLVGVGMASIAFWTINLCGSIVAGSWVGLLVLGGGLLGGTFLAELFMAVVGGEILYDWGFIGFLVCFICALPVLLLLAVLALPIAYVLGVFLVMMDNLDYCLEQPIP